MGGGCPASGRSRTGQLDDPAGKAVEAVRPIRDDIEGRVRELLDHLGVSVTS